MPNQPTQGTQPVEVLREFKGLNDQSDSVKRPPGTVTDMRNMYDEQAMDANRRPGRIFSSLDDGNPVGVIYQLSWADGFITNIVQSGSDFNFDTLSDYQSGTVDSTLSAITCGDGEPTTCPQGSELLTNAITGFDYCADSITGNPNCPPGSPNQSVHLPPRKDVQPVPDFVPLIRALGEAYYFANKANTLFGTLPTQRVGVNFYERTAPFTKVNPSPIRDKTQFLYWYNRGFIPRQVAVAPIDPETQFISITDMTLDFYYVDYVIQGPARYANTDLSTLIHIYNSQVLTLYLKTNPDTAIAPTTLSNYTSADAYTFSPNESNYKIVCAQFAGLINSKLLKVKVSATQSSLMTKTGTASDGGDCPDGITLPFVTMGSFSVIPAIGTSIISCGASGVCQPDCLTAFSGKFYWNGDDLPVCTYRIDFSEICAALTVGHFDSGSGSTTFYSGGQWNLAIGVEANPQDILWYGIYAGPMNDPRGVYSFNLGFSTGCTGPATVTLS